jgi:hypothetical protein
MIRSLGLWTLAALMAAADPWDAAIAAGFPEVRGAAIWVGAWRGSPHGITDWARDAGEADLHLRLPDGRWLLHGAILHPPAAPEDLLEPLATRWGDPAQDTRSERQGRRQRPGTAALALLIRAGLPGPRMEPLDDQAVLQALRRMAVLAPDPQDRQRLGAVLAALAPQQPVPELTGVPSWRLTYDTSTRDLLQERLSLTPTGPSRSDGRGSGWSPPWQPRDIPALVGLLGDPAPSRTWTEDGRLATIGEQALAALAWTWGLQQDQLRSGGDQPLATRLGALVTTHGDLVAALASAPDLRRLLHEPTLLEALPEDRRVAAGAVLAEDWSRLDATARDDLVASPAFGRCLGLVAASPDVARLLATWPVGGPLRALLACWHDRRGDPTALDALLTESLAAPDLPDLGAAWTWALGRPSTARFALVAQVVRLSVDHPLHRRVEQLLAQPRTAEVHGFMSERRYRWSAEDLMPAWWLVEDAAVRSRQHPSPVAARLHDWDDTRRVPQRHGAAPPGGPAGPPARHAPAGPGQSARVACLVAGGTGQGPRPARAAGAHGHRGLLALPGLPRSRDHPTRLAHVGRCPPAPDRHRRRAQRPRGRAAPE